VAVRVWPYTEQNWQCVCGHVQNRTGSACVAIYRTELAVRVWPGTEQNCGSACVAIYRTELCLCAVSECISAGSDTDNQRSASVVILVPAVNLKKQHYKLHHQQLFSAASTPTGRFRRQSRWCFCYPQLLSSLRVAG
jgi:hypothetical protein